MDEKKHVKEPKLKSITTGEKSFVANGVTYFIQSEISFDRWTMYRKLQVELSFATTFQELFNALGNAFDLLNELRLGDAAVVINTAMKGMEQVADERQTPTVLKLCALFINAEDEDVRFINDDLIDKKVTDWRKEGLNMGDFFSLALHSIPGFMNAYRSISRDTSENKKEEESRA